MPNIIINGINLHYELSGKGKALVMVHGLLSRGKGWSKQIEVFSPKYMVVAPDMRGHGKTDRPEKQEDYVLSKFSSDLYQLLRTLHIDRCCMIGHSWGGRLVSETAVEHPELVAGIVLIDTPEGKIKRSISQRARVKFDEKAEKHGWAKAFLDAMENDPEIAIFYNDTPEKLEKMRQKLTSADSQIYTYAWNAVFNAPSLIPDLKKINLPTLLICGGKDLPGLVAMSRAMHRHLSQSKLVVVKGVGHFPQDDAPGIVNREIEEFLSKLTW